MSKIDKKNSLRIKFLKEKKLRKKKPSNLILIGSGSLWFEIEKHKKECELKFGKKYEQEKKERHLRCKNCCP